MSGGRDTRAVRLGVLLVRGILLLYPRPVRERYGEEMLETFRAQALERSRRGPGAVAALVARTLPGMLRDGADAWTTKGGGAMGGWSGVGSELRLAVRRLRRAPGHAAVAVATLGLGVGVFGAVFAVVETVLLRPMPYEEPEELAWVWRDYAWRDFPRGWVGAADVLGLEEQPDDVFEAVAALRSTRMNLTGRGGVTPRDVRATRSTSNLFDVLGVEAALGRTFLPGEDYADEAPVAVLGHDLWVDAFGADPSVVGTDVYLNDAPTRIVGVLPRDFRFVMHGSMADPVGADLYLPLDIHLETVNPNAAFLAALVRKADGADPARVEAALDEVADGIDREWRVPEPGLELWLAPLKEDLVADARGGLLAVLAAAGFLLLVLATSLATLFAARTAARDRDLAVRAVLGAGRVRECAALLGEAVAVAAGGAAVALLSAAWGAGVLARVAAPVLPRAGEIRLTAAGGGLLVLLCLGLSLAATALPLLRALWRRPGRALRESGARPGTSLRRSRERDALVAAQVALSVVLLVGAGLLGRSLRSLLEVDPGFDPGHTLTFEVLLDQGAYPGRAELLEAQDELLRALRSTPGVRTAGAGNALPLGGTTDQAGARFPGAPGNVGDATADNPLVDFLRVTPGYVEAAGLRLLRGRPFREGDGLDEAVVIVDDVLARRFFPDGSAVGGRFHQGGEDTARIVGVVDQARLYGVERDDRGQIYVPTAAANFTTRSLHFVVRTDGPAEALAAPVRAAVASVDPGLPLSGLGTLEERVHASLGEERLNLGLVSAFAVASLLLAALGLYGVASHGVVRRRAEIGIRMALGAEGSRVVTLVLGQTGRLVGIGLAAGLAAAWVASGWVDSLLYGVAPTDLPTYGVVAFVLAAVALVAAWLPARRATRVHPAEALRAE